MARERVVKFYSVSDVQSLAASGKATIEDSKVKVGEHKNDAGETVKDYAPCKKINLDLENVSVEDLTAIFEADFIANAIQDKLNRDWSVSAKAGSPEVQAAKILAKMAELEAKLVALNQK